MIRWCAFVLSTLFLSCRCNGSSAPESACGLAQVLGEQNAIAMKSREVSGEWVTTITAYKVFEGLRTPPKVEVQRIVTECEGMHVVNITAMITGYKSATPTSLIETRQRKLRFYERGGKNAVVSANGTTAKRINELEVAGQGGILTNRALKDEELFEVRLDQLTTMYDDSLGIGVTYHTPKSVDYNNWMSCGTIMLFDHRLYEHGVVSRKQYGANLKNLRVGDRVGVMKKRNGDLHFFINGEDQGIAKSNIDYPVHGVVDVYGSAVQVSIV